MTDTIEVNDTRHQWKMKHLTKELRARVTNIPRLGVLEIKPGEWRPSKAWFINTGRNIGGVFSVRELDETLYIFRLR